MNGMYYVGSCIEINARMKDHKRGNTSTTRKYKPWKHVFSMPCGTLEEARALEKKLKKWKSRKMVESFMDANPNAQLVEQPRL